MQPVQPDDGQATVARPREFDHEKALDAAVDCFWSRGVGATSVRDLANGMGINGPSLYNAFGDKRTLFVQALERYADRSMRSVIQRLERDHEPADRIRKFLGTLIEKSLADPDHRGCLIVNSALEISPDDAEITHLIASYLGEIEAFFRRSLDRGRADGVISATIDARDAARLLLGVVLGIRVAARFRPERALLEGMVRPVLGLLDPPVQGKPAVKRRSRPVIANV